MRMIGKYKGRYAVVIAKEPMCVMGELHIELKEGERELKLP
jgi:hypothetical protein